MSLIRNLWPEHQLVDVDRAWKNTCKRAGVWYLLQRLSRNKYLLYRPAGFISCDFTILRSRLQDSLRDVSQITITITPPGAIPAEMCAISLKKRKTSLH